MIKIQNSRGAIPLEDEKLINGITIQDTRLNFPKRIIIEKPFVEATRHIRPLYIRAHLNGKPFSRILIDNGSAVNIMPSRLLHSLGKTAEELIVTDIVVAAFTGEVTKQLEFYQLRSLWEVKNLSMHFL